MSEPQALYAEALVLGEQLMRLLQQPATEVDMDLVESLLERRGAIAAATTGPVFSLPQLQELVSQQEKLESLLAAAMADLKQRRGDQLAQHQSVQAMNRLLRPGARSSLLNQRL